MSIAVEDASMPLARAPRRWGPWAPWACAALAVFALFAWYSWPATRGDDVDVVVVGNGAVIEARDEIGRRFRQEGLVVRVLEVEVSEPCVIDREALEGAAGARVVLSFSGDVTCRGPRLPDDGLVVEQPSGGRVAGLGDNWDFRSAAPLFPGGDVAVCEWWDTPGAGEARPGLGQCVGGGVRVLEDGHLTDAGKERFARLMVEAVR